MALVRAFHGWAAWLEIVLAFLGFFAIDKLVGWLNARRVMAETRP